MSSVYAISVQNETKWVKTKLFDYVDVRVPDIEKDVQNFIDF